MMKYGNMWNGQEVLDTKRKELAWRVTCLNL